MDSDAVPYIAAFVRQYLKEVNVQAQILIHRINLRKEYGLETPL